MTTRKRKRQRAEDQTTITFSCSSELKERIRAAADAERRSISNWVVCRLEQELNELQGLDATQPRLRRVAEERSEYSG